MFCNCTWVGKAEVQYLFSLLGIQRGGIGKQSNEQMPLLFKRYLRTDECTYVVFTQKTKSVVLAHICSNSEQRISCMAT
jgi:hypothetical protein